jgi:hypothetical protein
MLDVKICCDFMAECPTGGLGELCVWGRSLRLGSIHPRDLLADLAGRVDPGALVAMARRGGFPSICFFEHGEKAVVGSATPLGWGDRPKKLENPGEAELAELVLSFLDSRDTLKAARIGNVILPVYMLDHSGVSISVRPFGDPWDSGLAGCIYARMMAEGQGERETARLTGSIFGCRESRMVMFFLRMGKRSIHAGDLLGSLRQ